jgi:hypothetical protein
LLTFDQLYAELTEPEKKEFMKIKEVIFMLYNPQLETFICVEEAGKSLYQDAK